MRPQPTLLELEDKLSRALFFPLSYEDEQHIAEQFVGHKFDKKRLLGGAFRCSHGYVQVVCCKPLLEGGAPFPTIYWLTCPHLDQLCARLEAQGAITEMQRLLETKENEWLALHLRYLEIRKNLMSLSPLPKSLKPDSSLLKSLLTSGVGGIDFSKAQSAPKCLHLQVGTWLGMGEHPLSAYFENNIVPLNCERCDCCRERLPK